MSEGTSEIAISCTNCTLFFFDFLSTPANAGVSSGVGDSSIEHLIPILTFFESLKIKT